MSLWELHLFLFSSVTAESVKFTMFLFRAVKLTCRQTVKCHRVDVIFHKKHPHWVCTEPADEQTGDRSHNRKLQSALTDSFLQHLAVPLNRCFLVLDHSLCFWISCLQVFLSERKTFLGRINLTKLFKHYIMWWGIWQGALVEASMLQGICKIIKFWLQCYMTGDGKWMKF